MTRQKTIVIVEDEPNTAEMFAEMVNVIGYRASKSLDGSRAIAMISEKKPAAVVLDIMMPDISGLDVLRYMRRDPRLEKIPVIIVSAKGLPTDIQSGLDAGASRYLTKPVSFIDLRDAVNSSIHEAYGPEVN
jgi:DNA-binding response OmpR family regulator